MQHSPLPGVAEEPAMAAANAPFVEEEMVVDERLGYPRAYAKLCGDAALFNPHAEGPPFVFVPYALSPQEANRGKELNQLFPVIDPEATPSLNPDGFVNLLWRQLNHLGNAGFDPALFRVDQYGNVLYFHADPASPLCWDIDHWFPISRGGRTVPSNLRILQWQVCRKKHNKLEFLVPWWDLQLGISINQFLSLFASKNSDFRNRAFSFLFVEGGNEDLDEMQTVESHTFPRHFIENKRHVGLAPAGIVLSQRHSNSLALKPLCLKMASSLGEDHSKGLNSSIQISRASISKENNDPNIGSNGINPYLTIALARDSLKQREEAKKVNADINTLDDKLNTLKQNNETERLALQDLEDLLIKKRKRVEKSRRLAEAQSSYKSLLEKMIRDAMHQTVLYKEQLRQNQAASSALMARLEAQRSICDASERDLLRKHKQRDDIEKQIVPCQEHARKRSRIDDEEVLEEGDDEANQSLTVDRISEKPSRKELRLFLEEEQKAHEASLSRREEELVAGINETDMTLEYGGCPFPCQKEPEKGKCSKINRTERDSITPSPLLTEVDEECRAQNGKDNVEKWLQILLERKREASSSSSSSLKGVESENQTEGTLHLLNPQKEIRFLRLEPSKSKKECSSFRLDGEQTRGDHTLESSSKGRHARTSSGCDDFGITKLKEGKLARENGGRGGMVRSASAKSLRSLPSSPSVSVKSLRPFPSSPSAILGMRRGMACMSKKPLVMGDDDDMGNSCGGGRRNY